MRLRFFNEEKLIFNEGDFKSIILKENENNILSISKNDKTVIIREECDSYFLQEFTKQEAIDLLKEAIRWIQATQPLN